MVSFSARDFLDEPKPDGVTVDVIADTNLNEGEEVVIFTTETEVLARISFHGELPTGVATHDVAAGQTLTVLVSDLGGR